VLGHFNAGFLAAGFYRLLGAQASPELRFKRALVWKTPAATGLRRRASGLNSIAAKAAPRRAGGRRRQMTTTTRSRDRKKPVKLLTSRRGRHRRRFAGIFARSRDFISSAGRPVRCAGHDRREESQERRRQPLRSIAQGPWLRVLPQRQRKNPFVAVRSSARLARWSPTALRRWCWPMVETALQLKKAIAFRSTAHVSDFLPMSKRDILKFEGCAEAWSGRSPVRDPSTSSLVERMTASPSPS